MRIFCKHDYSFLYNLYGDQINYHGGNRSVWQCKKCGKLKDFPQLVKDIEEVK